MKTEIFAFSGNVTDGFMQDTINPWFLEHPDIKVKFVTQSEAMNDSGDTNITISIFYIEDVMKGGQEDGS